MPSKRKASSASDAVGQAEKVAKDDASEVKGKRAARAASSSSAAAAAATAPEQDHAQEHQVDGLAHLAKQVGVWDVDATMYDAEGKAMGDASPATSTFSLILNGKVLEEKYEQEMGGFKYEGIGHYAFDALTKEFQFSWVSNFDSSVRLFTGALDENDEKTIRYNSTPYVGSQSKKKQTALHVHKLVSNDEAQVDMFSVYGKKKVMSMKLVYKRRVA